MNTDDHIATIRYGEGYVREWDLRLREWRRRFVDNSNRQPTSREVEVYFHQIHHLTQWVPDPDFGKPMQLTDVEVEYLETALRSNRPLLKQFQRFLDKHAPQPTLGEAY